MEDLDIAAERTELERAYLVEAIRRRAGASLPPTGQCYYCAEGVTNNRLFCDKECAEGYEYEKRRRG